MLVSHFLLDLQDAGRRDVQLDTNEAPADSVDHTASSLNFARVVGSIATTLRNDSIGTASTSDLELHTNFEVEDGRVGMDAAQFDIVIGQGSRDETVLA